MKKNSRKPFSINPAAGIVILIVSVAAIGVIATRLQRPTPPLEVAASAESQLCEGKEGKVCEAENDVNGTIATTNQIDPNSNKKHMGYIGGGDPADYWKVSLTAGNKYQAVVVKDDNDKNENTKKERSEGGGGGEKPKGDRSDKEITLYDSSGPVAGVKAGNSFTFETSTAKVYFVKVSPIIANKVRYQFTFKELSK